MLKLLYPNVHTLMDKYQKVAESYVRLKKVKSIYCTLYNLQNLMIVWIVWHIWHFLLPKKEIFCKTISPKVFKRDWCQKFGQCCGFLTRNGNKNLFGKTISPVILIYLLTSPFLKTNFFLINLIISNISSKLQQS